MKAKPGIWHYIKNYKFDSIFIKNLLMILVIATIPLIISSMAVYNYYDEAISEEINAANMNSLFRVRDMVDMLVSQMDAISINIASNTDVIELMSAARRKLPDYDTAKKVEDIWLEISKSNIANNYIDSVYIYFEKQDYIIATNHGGIKRIFFYDDDWFPEYYRKRQLTNYWISVRRLKSPLGQREKKYFLSSYRGTPLLDEDKAGVVVINISINRLGEWINDINNRRYENIFIIEQDNNILFNSDVSIINENIANIDILKGISLEDEDKPVKRSVNGNVQVISMVHSKYNNWIYISVIPLLKYQERMIDLRVKIIRIIIVSILVAMVFIFFISVRIFEPIKNIMSVIQNPEPWLGETSNKDEAKWNEFKFIISNIVNSYGQKRKIEQELSYRLRLLKKSQAMALQSQINPHFLYNALDTINWKAIRLTGGSNQVSEMISVLSELLRISLETDNNLIPIRTEVEHARLYVTIQKSRYKDKFDVLWEISEAILDCKIIKIALQPIIENSIYHGIKPKSGDGILSVSGHLQDGNIVFKVKDNGVGIPAAAVDIINEDMCKDYIKEGHHIGLRNVNQRIKLTFGEQYGLTVGSRLDAGTEVTIVIPVVS